MGNQIKFSPKKKDESFSVSEENYRTLEIENIQLKNTNRKLISKLDKQKNLIKNLALELKTIKNKQQNKGNYALQKEYQQLIIKHDDLQEELNKSREEIARLKKNLIKNSTGNSAENSSTSNKTKETSEASTTSSHWNRLKSRLPDDIKNLRDSKKNE